jgi:hypothetical protein
MSVGRSGEKNEPTSPTRKTPTPIVNNRRRPKDVESALTGSARPRIINWSATDTHTTPAGGVLNSSAMYGSEIAFMEPSNVNINALNEVSARGNQSAAPVNGKVFCGVDPD